MRRHVRLHGDGQPFRPLTRTTRKTVMVVQPRPDLGESFDRLLWEFFIRNTNQMDHTFQGDGKRWSKRVFVNLNATGNVE
jgi:hypothetical protein